jgi:hypothetical protein
VADQDDWKSFDAGAASASGAAAVEAPAEAGAQPIVRETKGFGAPALAGAAAAIVGAVGWAAITFATHKQFGLVAIGIGLLVAVAVRRFGDQSIQHAMLSGGLALFGCVLGNLLSACAFVSDAQSVPMLQVVARVLSRPALAARVLQETFDPGDLIFYAIATYEGFKLVLMRRRS